MRCGLLVALLWPALAGAALTVAEKAASVLPPTLITGPNELARRVVDPDLPDA